MADLALGSTPSPSMDSCEEGHGMQIKPLQRSPSGPGSRGEHLTWAPGKESGGVKTAPMNSFPGTFVLLSTCAAGSSSAGSPAEQPQPGRHSWMSVKNNLMDQDPD